MINPSPDPESAAAVQQSHRHRLNCELPFGIIQIAGWSNRCSMTYDMNHHTNVIREIQFDVWQRTEKSGLIATCDTNSTREPSNRWEIVQPAGP